MRALKRAKVSTIYLNGSFVTAKENPNDYDVTWEMTGFDVTKLDPIFADFDDDRAAQKRKYGGEFFPVVATDISVRRNFLKVFQRDKHTYQQKGIVAIDLGGMR